MMMQSGAEMTSAGTRIRGWWVDAYERADKSMLNAWLERITAEGRGR
jgi:5-carboxymethyl-2-hydroxymuconate isomerase